MFKYFSRKQDAMKFADALLEETGYNPSIFRDGKSYRVQEDRVGVTRGWELLQECFPGIDVFA